MKCIIKKAAIIVIAVVTMSMVAQAQVPSFNKGDNVVSVGVGIGGYYSGSFYSGSGVNRMPAISLYYENCVKDNLFDAKSSLGIGGMVGYTSAKWSNYWKTSHTTFGVRGALHYALVNKLDTYTGLMLGYDVVSWKYYDTYYKSSGNAASDIAFSWFLGARYYLTDTFAAFAEVGYGVANFNLGLTLKF